MSLVALWLEAVTRPANSLSKTSFTKECPDIHFLPRKTLNNPTLSTPLPNHGRNLKTLAS